MYKNYAAVINKKKILVLNESYKEKYDAFTYDEKLGKGSGPARNFAWEHSMEKGHERHWILDDNIYGFHIKNKDTKFKVKNSVIFECMENFVDRYKNIGIAGPQYKTFIHRKEKVRVFTMNTRVFSCILIKNSMNLRWRGRYNEDVDLSIRALKQGYCNILFNMFLQNKAATQTLKGGNTDLLYKGGTKKKSEMLKKMHPEMVELTYRYGRPHHKVDFSKYKKRALKLKDDVKIENKIDNYGMKLKYQ